ncbi:MAG: hypothetical protein ACTSO7_12625 [Candidatus Heimdallarchaeota archaeon]
MSKSESTSEIVLVNCIANEDSNCADCDINELLFCRFDKKYVRGFMLGNTFYRILAITILIITGFIFGHWWMVGTYTGLVILTFFVIEPRLLCSHCPYYEKDGKFLKCWALRGMPKFWKYRPGPMKKWEKILMLIFVSFIDLFPFVGVIWGIVVFARDPNTTLYLGIALIIVSSLFTILAFVFGEFLIRKNCKKCANFSCGMNKVEPQTVAKFLDKNPKMKAAWEESGWKSPEN